MNKFLQTILLAILTTLSFSAFIYFEEYDMTNKLINTILGLSSLALFLYIPKRSVLIAGFLIGLFWFYWIGYSFEYQGVGFMTPIITLAFGFIYMLFFGVLALTKEVYIRAILLFALSFFEPFDWNWLQIELVFVDSYIGVLKYQLFLVLLSLSLPAYVPKAYKAAPLILLLTTLDYATPKLQEAPLKIKLVQTDVKQEVKWLASSKNTLLMQNLQAIVSAIEEGYDVVVLPESVFPIFMNTHPILQLQLRDMSQHISIIAGALLFEGKKNYNVTYFFEDGEMQVAKKMVLVPFGEYIPLPKFARDFVNNTFFSGESDFIHATEPTDFIIKGVKFRNAICYEATCQELYEGDVKYVIATSNNAWFAPSIEPTLQKLLMKYYARKNGVIIYHSANWSGSGVVQ
jgi:apolipoprotein N-acyltransferase